MKSFLTCLVLLFFVTLSAQSEDKINGLFYKIAVSATLTTNEDYTIANDYGDTFINLNGIFINNTIGYQFDSRSSIGLNLEYDHYLDQNLNFFPAYLDFTYNILDFDDQVFSRGGYGKLLDLGKSFENGTLYKAGVGYRIYDDDFKSSCLIGFDFSRKRFGYRQNDKLSSFAIFLEFMFF